MCACVRACASCRLFPAVRTEIQGPEVFLQARDVKLGREQPAKVGKFTDSSRAKLYFTPLLWHLRDSKEPE